MQLAAVALRKPAAREHQYVPPRQDAQHSITYRIARPVRLQTRLIGAIGPADAHLVDAQIAQQSRPFLHTASRSADFRGDLELDPRGAAARSADTSSEPHAKNWQVSVRPMRLNLPGSESDACEGPGNVRPSRVPVEV